jgi:hypothetical protein
MTRASLRSVGGDVAWLVTRARYRPTLTHAFYLGVEPMQRRGVNSSCQVQSHLFMCSRLVEGDSWAPVSVT